MGQRASRMLSQGMNVVDRGLQKVWRRARLAMLALQLTASVMGGMAVKAALDYERSLRQVFTLFEDAGSAAKEFQERFQDMDRTIREISTRTKTLPTQLATGLYDVVSTGFDAASATVVLENAARGAYAGLTDVDTATGLLTTTLQAYRQEGETAMDLAMKSERVMDMFFNAVNVGVFTFEELGAKFGDVASTAAAFGVKLEDLLAFLSTATVRGIGLDEAITAARQTLLSIAAATPQSQEALEKLFGSSEAATAAFSAQALAEKGLIGVMTELSNVIGTKIDRRMVEMATAMEEEGGNAAGFLAEKIGISVEAFTDLFPNVRALKGVLAVSGPGLETYGEHFDTIATNMGAVDRAAQEIDKSASGALQGLKAVWEQFKIDAGGIALPWIKSIADNLVQWWGGLPERFAQETGFEPKVMGDIPSERFASRRDQIAEHFADATPGEKIGFILRTAWSDALDNLNRWFDGGGGDKLASIGEKIGRFIGETLMSLAGVEGQDIENNIFYKMGEAGARGFMAGFKAAFDSGDFFGGMFGGDNVIGNVLMGYAGLKLLPRLFRGGGGGAGGLGGAGGAAAGGGLLSRLFGGAGAAIPLLSGAALVGAAQEGVIEDFFKTAFGMQPFRSTVHHGDFNYDVQRSATSRHASRVSGPGAGAQANFAQFLNPFQRSGEQMDGAAGTIDSAGSRMSGAASIMFAAANRMANIKVTVSGGGRFNGGAGDPRARFEAEGGSGTVRRPTLFVAGEQGPEDFEFVPHNRSSRGRSGKNINVYMGGVTVASDYDVKRMMAAMNREIEKALGNG
jgi:TP901 family phage tail tape measure protein